MRNIKEKKVGVAVLHSTRYDNSKGNRIGPSLFYASELHSKYNKKRAGFETCSLIIYCKISFLLITPSMVSISKK
jgi:hypothetical protein